MKPAKSTGFLSISHFDPAAALSGTDAQVGAVILTNSDEGELLLRPFMRRLLEILYDGKPEAAGDVC